jgi:tetratricopeptide (TPR) repeat protein
LFGRLLLGEGDAYEAIHPARMVIGPGVGEAEIEQDVSVASGVGAGVIGADLHIYADGVPLYLLVSHAPAARAGDAWLRELPSRMLNARFRVVGFTLRRDEGASLHQWRRSDEPLAVRWLHGDGGQGKTRLANQFADEAAIIGWKVIHAIHGPGTILPLERPQQDLRLGDASGVLMIVDYADRWPLTDLILLLANKVLRQGVPARVLLIARGTDGWPGVRAILADDAAASDQQLLALETQHRQREEMFTAAWRSFAAVYGISDPPAVPEAGLLDNPDMGLTLAIHMAALVDVDSRLAGREPPRGMEAMTVYLLDRENLHWASLYGETGRHSDRPYRTPPEVMNRTVFTAAMTGPLPIEGAARVLGRLRFRDDAGQVLHDHGMCYPAAPGSRGGALEPLYPDRLAEDFLALTLPGHTADYPSQAWAETAAQTLLTGGRDLLRWLPRSVTFLAAAAHRWPHVGEQHLYPLLRSKPQLLLAAGSGAIITLTSIDTLDMRVLEAAEPLLPEDSNVTLDIGAAAITERLTRHRLPAETDPVKRARMFGRLSWRYTNAGRALDALEAAQEAVAILRRLPPQQQHQHRDALARMLANLGGKLSEVGRHDDGLAATTEAASLQRVLAREDAARHAPDLALSLHNIGVQLRQLGRLPAALPPTEEAVRIYRSLAGWNLERHLPALAGVLGTLGTLLSDLDRAEESLAATTEALAIRQRLATEEQQAHQPDYAVSLANLGAQLSEGKQWHDALAQTEKAMYLQEQVSNANKASYEPARLALAHNHAGQLWELGRHDEAVAEALTVVDGYRSLAASLPDQYETLLATALANLGKFQLMLNDPRALATLQEAVEIRRRRTGTAAEARVVHLVLALTDLAAALAQRGRYSDAFDVAREAVERQRGEGQATSLTAQQALAPALTVVGAIAAEMGHLEDALDAMREAVGLYRLLADRHPASSRPKLAAALGNLSLVLRASGQEHEAAEAEREARSMMPRGRGE